MCGCGWVLKLRPKNIASLFSSFGLHIFIALIHSIVRPLCDAISCFVVVVMWTNGNTILLFTPIWILNAAHITLFLIYFLNFFLCSWFLLCALRVCFSQFMRMRVCVCVVGQSHLFYTHPIWNEQEQNRLRVYHIFYFFPQSIIIIFQTETHQFGRNTIMHTFISNENKDV